MEWHDETPVQDSEKGSCDILIYICIPYTFTFHIYIYIYTHTYIHTYIHTVSIIYPYENGRFSSYVSDIAP